MIDITTAKAHLRVVDDSEDSIIGIYLAAAIGAVESATGKLLTPREVQQTLAGFPCDGKGIRLWWGPIDADTVAPVIAYDAGDGVEQSLAEFRIVEGSNAKLLPAYGTVFPSAQRADGSVRISYTAGYAANAVPPELDQAVLFLTGHYYANREAVVAGGTGAGAAEKIDGLIAPYRTIAIG